MASDKKNFPLSRSRVRIWSHDTGSDVPSRASLLIFHTQAESGACLRDSSRFPRRRPYTIKQCLYIIMCTQSIHFHEGHIAWTAFSLPALMILIHIYMQVPSERFRPLLQHHFIELKYRTEEIIAISKNGYFRSMNECDRFLLACLIRASSLSAQKTASSQEQDYY